MTNQLFRDLLEGRIEVDGVRHEGHMHGPIPVTDPARIERGEYFKYIFCINGCSLEPPADPRARALWAKEQQGHGPELDTLRNRGRINHYRTKG